MRWSGLLVLAIALALAGGGVAGAFPDDPTGDGVPAGSADTSAIGPSAIELRVAETFPADPMASLPLRRVTTPVEEAAGSVYARVVTPDAPVYNAPNGQIVRTMGTGFIFVVPRGSRYVDGVAWTQIGGGEWMRQSDIDWRTPSSFRGVEIDGWPEHEFAWILQPNQPLLSPAGPPNKDAPFLERYQLVPIYATEWVGEWRYYLIAPDQWARESWLGKVQLNPVPEGVSGRWIDIDLYEQTLTAYVDDRPVYATLIASGLAQWSTNEGLFQVWYKVPNIPMSGAYGQPDYYYLPNVPWNLFFDGDSALHGAYWHDGFGYRRSHGCVNLAPVDALWLFNWADVGTWVHAHHSHAYR